MTENKYLIGNYPFDDEWLRKYLTEVFAEEFAHTSLTCEEAFKESSEYAQKLNEFVSPENTLYANELLESDNEEDKNTFKTKMAMVRSGLISQGINEETFVNDFGMKLPGVDEYAKYFKGAIRPYNSTKEIKKARRNEELKGKSYEVESMAQRIYLLVDLIKNKLIADYQAAIMKKSHNDAFKHALSLKSIGIKEIIEINTIINECTGTHTGFKTANNTINGTGIETSDKRLVYDKMTQLIYNYNYV